MVGWAERVETLTTKDTKVNHKGMRRLTTKDTAPPQGSFSARGKVSTKEHKGLEYNTFDAIL